MKRIILAAGLLLAACSAADAPESFNFRGEERPEYARTVAPGELDAMGGPVTLLDVRLEEDYRADPDLIPGATWANPDDIASWSSELPKDAPVVVYCVKGKWVSQKAADFLSRQGLDVYSLDGGLVGWRAEVAGAEPGE